MVHRCCISSCGMNVRVAEAKGLKGLTYHCFPLKEPNREKWIQVILPYVDKPEGFKIVQGYTRVCSRHFRRKDYSLDSRKRARLNSNAIPSVFHIKSASAPVSTESLLENAKPLWTSQESPSFKLLTDKDCDSKLQVEEDESITILFTNIKADISNRVNDLKPDRNPTEYAGSRDSPAHKLVESDVVIKNKHHKRRKVRNSVTQLLKSHKRTNTSDDLNIEGVGEALAEINLSRLMAVSRKGHKDRIKEMKSESKLSDESVTATHPEGEIPISSPNEPNGFELVYSTAVVGKLLTTETLEQSIRAVNIHCGEPVIEGETSLPAAEVEKNLITMMGSRQDELQLNSELDAMNLAEELFSGESVLSSLDGSELTSFDTQDLLEAFRDTSDHFPSADEIDKLACDLNSSFLDNEGLKPLLLDLDEIRISDLELPSSFNSDHWIDFGSDMISQLSHISFEPSVEVLAPEDKQIAKTEAQKLLEIPPDVPKIKITLSLPQPSTSLAGEQITLPPVVVTKKPGTKNNSNCTGRFSAERFRDCHKDIEYYTGFSTYQEFETFYHTLDAHAEKLKVTDIMYGATSLVQASSDNKQDLTAEESVTANDTGLYVEDGRRLSQGRSMIRIDELFLTLIRLKRKLPEKVLGHMFCASQSTVSRIVRAWVMLLSKFVETLPSKSTSPKSRKSNSAANLNTDEKNSGIPNSVLKLFHSAKSIVHSGNSRKTSCSTCTSTSRSKRPKKEKLAGSALENSTALVPPDGEDVVISDGKTSIGGETRICSGLSL